MSELVVVLVVLLGRATAPETLAMQQTLRAVIGDPISISVRETENVSSAAAPEPGTVVVLVDAPDAADACTVRLRGLGLDAEHTVTFRAEDAPFERGRTLAFVVASMLPAYADGPVALPRVQPPDPGTPHEDPSTSAQADSSPEDGIPHPADGLTPARRAESIPRRWTLRASGACAKGSLDDDTSTTYGGAVQLSRWLGERLALSTWVEARTGTVEHTSSATTWLGAGLGVVVGITAPPAVHAFGVEALFGIGIGRQSASHFSSDDESPVPRADVTGLNTVRLDLSFRVTDAWHVALGVGVDFVWNSVDIYVADERRATLAHVRPAALLGLEARL